MISAFFLTLSTAAAVYNGDENILSSDEKGLSFESDQSISGTGFFAAYRYSSMPDGLGIMGSSFNGVQAKSRAHGSGTVRIDSRIHAEHSYKNESYITAVYHDGELTDELEETTSTVRMDDEEVMVHSPTSISLGSRYYSIHPIVFKSLLNDEVFIKNHNGLNSMGHSIEGAHMLERTLDAQSDADNSSLNVEETMRDGIARFRAIQLRGAPSVLEDLEETPEEGSSETPVMVMKSWKMPISEVIEDYSGTFSMKKNMTITIFSEEVDEEEDWLPCCRSEQEAAPDYSRKPQV